MTLATDAAFIIEDEYKARAAAEANTLSDDELRERVGALLAEEGTNAYLSAADAKAGPELMPRAHMIEMLAANSCGCPPTFAIPADADDPLVEDARELRREEWEQNVAAAIKSMGLTGPAAERHRAAAEEAELVFLRQLTEEIWELPEADLRLRALEIIAKLAGGSEGDKKFPYDPLTLSRGHLLAAIAAHINWLTWSPELRRDTRLAAE